MPDDFAGYLQPDANEGHNTVVNKISIKPLGCWAHVRCKFDESLKARAGMAPEKRKTSLAAEALRRIQVLYRVKWETKLLGRITESEAETLDGLN